MFIKNNKIIIEFYNYKYLFLYKKLQCFSINIVLKSYMLENGPIQNNMRAVYVNL